MRPYLLTETVRRRLLDALQAGATITAAAEMCGIARRTLNDWLAAARKAGAPEALVPFAKDVELAKARAQVSIEMLVRKHAEKHPKTAQWMLERRYTKDWGKRDPAREEQNERVLDLVRKLFKDMAQMGIFSGAIVLEQEALPAPEIETARPAQPEPLPPSDPDAPIGSEFPDSST